MDTVDLSQLKPEHLGLSQAWCLSHAECAVLCLIGHDHKPGVAMTVDSNDSTSLTLVFPVPEDKAKTSWEVEQATEMGAYAIGLLVVKKLFGVSKFQRSYRGKDRGFDFYGGDDGTVLFQKTTRFELSGIFKGDASVVGARVLQKLAQIGEADIGLPAYAVVVEFSQPATALRAK